MKLNLKPRLVAAVAQFKAEKDIRYYLNGVYADPQATGVLLVAANGHAMGAWLDPAGEIDRPAILRIDEKLQAACRSAKPGTQLQLVDGRLAVVEEKSGAEIYVQPGKKWEVDGKFPDWTKVIVDQDGPASLQSALNPKYVELISKALRIGAESKFRGITTRQRVDQGAVTFTSVSAPDFVGIVASMRDSIAPMPGWLRGASLRSGMRAKAVAAPLPVHEPSDSGPPDGDGRGWEFVKGGAA